MSTYFYLACESCKEYVPFVGTSNARCYYLGGENKERTIERIPRWFYRHSGEDCRVRVLSEHDLDRDESYLECTDP